MYDEDKRSPHFIHPPAVRNRSDGSLVLECIFEAPKDYHAQWYFRDRPLSSGTYWNMNIAQPGRETYNATLEIKEMNDRTSGCYMCSVKNKAGSAQAKFDLRPSEEEDFLRSNKAKSVEKDDIVLEFEANAVTKPTDERLGNDYGTLKRAVLNQSGDDNGIYHGHMEVKDYGDHLLYLSR